MTEMKLSDDEIMRFIRGNSRSRRAFLAGFGATAAAFTLASCGGKKPSPTGGKETGTLQFYNWDTYIGETTLEDFKTASGVDVNMTIFSNNDELFAKFRAGNPGYDVIVPSNDYVTRMGETGMLMPLDHSKIPNLKNVDPAFMNPDFDPGRKYSIPYTYLVTGIGYRISKLKNGVIPDSWKYLFDSDEYSGRISVLGESLDLFRLVFKYLGKSVNDFSPELLKQAEDLLIKQKKHIKKFHSDDGQDLLARKEVDLVLEYNGDIAQAKVEDDDIDFVVPKEGSMLTSDCMAIPVGAKSPNNAHAFLNFILDAKNGQEITKTILYPTPNAAAKALMDDSYKNNPIIFPPQDKMDKCEYGKYKGPEVSSAIEAAMTKVRAS